MGEYNFQSSNNFSDPGYNFPAESNSFEMGGLDYINQGGQSSNGNLIYGMPSKKNNQPDFSSGPTSISDSQCPTGGNCIKCTYRCRMRKV